MSGKLFILVILMMPVSARAIDSAKAPGRAAAIPVLPAAVMPAAPVVNGVLGVNAAAAAAGAANSERAHTLAETAQTASQLIAPIVAAAADGASDESVSRAGQDLGDLRPSQGGGEVSAVSAFDAAVQAGAATVKEFRSEVARVIVGQKEAVDLTLVSLLVNRGHLLLEGMPGLGKTKLVEAVSAVSGLTSQRIQFRPDLLPSDIGGFKDKDAQGNWYTKKGPILKGHIIQADEINRGTPRAKAALLQPMQEGKVTIDDETYKLETPFLVLATMNPIDTEGVFPMLEPEKDRFLVSAFVDYPSEAEEAQIAREQSKQEQVELKQVLSVDKINALRGLIEKIPVSVELETYIQRVVRATRPPSAESGDDAPYINLKGYVTLGAGPRASIAMMQVARVYAFLDGRSYVNADDVQKAALPVLRHRIKLSSKAGVARMRSETIIADILRRVPIPR